MIEKLHIKNFKSHSDSPLTLGNINIFTGMNGMGKSSAIQSLLLLRQSQSRGLLKKGLELNGDLCSIGSIKDAVYQFAEDSDNIDVLVTQNAKVFDWSFKADAQSIGNTFALINKEVAYNPDEFSLFNNGFQYISAFRNGPVSDYEKDTASVELLNQISRKEGRCELVAHYFDYFKDCVVHPDLVKNKEIDHSVKNQVEEWLREISPNINIHIQPLDTSFKITYSFNRGKGLPKTDNFRGTNIGFGVSYVLPIILAAIVANSKEPKEGSTFSTSERLIIIENPEAHIHPKAQAKLMELICLAAKNGVQFIIETHSDHIINSLLVAVKHNIIAPEQSKIYYFNRSENNHATDVIELQVLSGGKIKNAPMGFFDQIDIHMKQLMGFNMSVNLFLLLPESTPSNQWMRNNTAFQSIEGINQFVLELNDKLEEIKIENYTGYYDLQNVNNFLSDYDTLEECYPKPARRLLSSSITSFYNWRENTTQSNNTQYLIFSQQVLDHTFCEVAQLNQNFPQKNHTIVDHNSHTIGNSVTISVDGQNININSLGNKQEIVNWFILNRQPTRKFHVSEKHGENRQEIRYENNKMISPLRCGETEARDLLQSAIGVNLKELFNKDRKLGYYIVFKLEGNNPQNQYHGYHVEFTSNEVPDAIKEKLEK